MKELTLNFKDYCGCARRLVAEGQVLLENKDQVLPLPKGAKVAVFGRIQSHYYKSGTGSGGMVNVDKVTGILDALLEEQDVAVDQELIKVYEEWEKEHPFDEGVGWGNEPWCQEEMPLSEELLGGVSARAEYALVIIGRTAGEDQDNKKLPGSWFLTELEEEMLEKVRKAFSKMIVILNVGNIMDMGFVDTYQPDAVLYAWQGGMIGGYGTVDVLTGKENPSGKLSDTIAYQVEDYPSDANFGNTDADFYQEDIYVGYRYFETAAREKVRYPFGYGLSYTSFSVKGNQVSAKDQKLSLKVQVKNEGTVAGKEVAQVYITCPQGKLGKPALILAAFQKTEKLEAGKTQELTLTIPFDRFASYDETGLTGYPASFVLEEGTYQVFAGNSVRNLQKAGEFILSDTMLLQRLSSALGPVKSFTRMKAVKSGEGYQMEYEAVPLRKESPAERRAENLPEDLPLSGDKGYRLLDVENGKVSMEAFIAQLSKEDLSCIIRGEGMGSPKVTPGTAAAFGGISESLKNFGIPCGCCSDGPSGMRLDSGMKAFSLPNGTLMACSFNEKLVEELYTFTGVEMVKNRVDALLGPGINLHRHPLNGRNFEYFSEDPLLTGTLAAAQIRALHQSGVTGTLKHFCANNQETGRHTVDSIVSERALRELYLKPFEMAIKESGAESVMTTYGSVNGLWTSGSYDLNTTILRKQWGFEGIVMTDWWAFISEEGKEPDKTNFAAMARAQNDIYMVCSQADRNETGDNTLDSLEAGTLTLGELQRNAANICGFLMNTHAFERMNGEETVVRVEGAEETSMAEGQNIVYYKIDEELTIDLSEISAAKGTDFVFALDMEKVGGYRVALTASSQLSELAQIPVSLFYQSTPNGVFTFNGTGGRDRTIEKKVVLKTKYSVLRLYFGQNGLRPERLHVIFDKPLDEITDDDAYVSGISQ